MGKLELLMKFLDLFLHALDIYSDIEVTVTLFVHCQSIFYIFSLSVFAFSYITTVLALRFVTHRKETWNDAILYPYHTIRITSKKIITIILSEYSFHFPDYPNCLKHKRKLIFVLIRYDWS